MIEILTPFLDNITKHKIIYPIIINGISYQLYLQYNFSSPVELNTNIDAIVIMLSSIAICNKWKITSKLPIDTLLYDNLIGLPNSYKKYYKKHTGLLSMLSIDELNLILDMPTCTRNNNKGLNANITPISMGIDSLHTILLNKDDLDHIIYINELDLSNKDPEFYNKINMVSNKYNKKLIIVNSNFKNLILSLKINTTDNNIITMHGTNYGVFTSDAILLASCYPIGIKKLYFSGFGSKSFPCLMGQHTDINKYFNSSEFITINNETERIKKIDYIVKNDKTLIKDIRVCNNMPTKKCNNCSKCGKCMKTILYFYMLGYYNTLNNTFLLPRISIIKKYLIKIHKYPHAVLSDIYFNKVYEGWLKLYLQNTMKPLTNIINDYTGDFINEDYHLSNNV